MVENAINNITKIIESIIHAYFFRPLPILHTIVKSTGARRFVLLLLIIQFSFAW